MGTSVTSAPADAAEQLAANLVALVVCLAALGAVSHFGRLLLTVISVPAATRIAAVVVAITILSPASG
ncbi:hypothetical protein [Sphingomonas corticis]|uniref:Uncharacterized protein n=1 Tax=Sphingomonas corticis TaxID=2722791 RepID=A0ABX1CQ28_9SPHN|nr:hypothetical protein [Sphingomonas corticis]NJR80046.1 hypothetical protein [Sphingomonas corticis]